MIAIKQLHLLLKQIIHGSHTDQWYGKSAVQLKGNLTERIELVKRVKMGQGFISLFPNVRHPMHHEAIIKGQIQNITPCGHKEEH